MHRQGFFTEDIQKVIKTIQDSKLDKKLNGVYTHFASAKNIAHKNYTDKQIEEFKKVQIMFKESSLEKIIFHTSGTGGTVLYPQANFDMVRIGIGLYGYLPSKESEKQHLITLKKKLTLKPVLSWKAKISEVKKLKKGDYVGYDLAEKLEKDTLVSIIPIGYWHGFNRTLSHKGQVLVKDKRCKVVGKVSMDLTIIECKSPATKVGDVVTIIGKNGKEVLTADDHVETSNNMIYKYEVLTTINPLIKRVSINKK
jgi:alanine racemase